MLSPKIRFKNVIILKNHNARGDIMKNNDWTNPRINWGALRDVQIIEVGAVPDLRKTLSSTKLSGTQIPDVYLTGISTNIPCSLMGCLTSATCCLFFVEY